MKNFAEWLEERDPEMLEEIFSPETWNKMGRYARGAAALGLTALSFLGGPGQAQAQNPGGGVRGLPSGRVMQDEESPSGQNAPSSAGIVAGDLASKMAETRKNVQSLADDLAKNAFDKAKTDEEKAELANKISQRSQKVGNIRYYAFANRQVGAAGQRGNLLQKIATSKATSSAIKEEGGKVRVIGIGSAVSGNVVITTVAVEIME